MTRDPKRPEPGTKRIYRGLLVLARHPASGPTDPEFLRGLGSAHDDDCPADDDTPLAAQLAAGAARYGTEVRVKFVTGDDRASADPLDPFGTGWAHTRGTMVASGTVSPGPRPGGWVVAEQIRVGEMDLLFALRVHAGRFCHLEVTYGAA